MVFGFCYLLSVLQGNSGLLLNGSGMFSKTMGENWWEIYRYKHDMNHDNFSTESALNTYKMQLLFILEQWADMDFFVQPGETRLWPFST